LARFPSLQLPFCFLQNAASTMHYTGLPAVPFSLLNYSLAVYDMNCNTRIFLAVTWSVFISLTLRADEPSEIALWPEGVPVGAKPLAPEKIAQLKANANDPERINFVDSPTLTIYRAPAETANGCAIVICPGGAYNILAWPKEGLEVAQWLNTHGVTAGVLKYRVPRRDPDEPHHEPLQDSQRAVRLMRANAEQWNIDKQRVGVLGFSAGGHLTVMTGLHGDTGTYPAKDAIDQQSCKPSFLVPIYAAYLGEKYNDRNEIALGSLVKITSGTPPTFLAVTADDAYRGVQAASLFIALKQANVPAELHIYARGGHGYGIRASDRPVSTWHHRLADWLRDAGYLQKQKK
jgi:acetyl esterase/lipase